MQTEMSADLSSKVDQTLSKCKDILVRLYQSPERQQLQAGWCRLLIPQGLENLDPVVKSLMDADALAFIRGLEVLKSLMPKDGNGTPLDNLPELTTKEGLKELLLRYVQVSSISIPDAEAVGVQDLPQIETTLRNCLESTLDTLRESIETIKDQLMPFFMKVNSITASIQTWDEDTGASKDIDCRIHPGVGSQILDEWCQLQLRDELNVSVKSKKKRLERGQKTLFQLDLCQWRPYLNQPSLTNQAFIDTKRQITLLECMPELPPFYKERQWVS